MEHNNWVKILIKIRNAINRIIRYAENRALKGKRNKFEKLFKDGSFIIHRLDEHNSIRLYKDSLLSQFVIEGFEKDEEAFIKKFLKPGDILMDIGANIGLHSIFAGTIVGHSGHVYAFEPTPTTFKRLKENIELNNLENIVTPINQGISSENGLLKLNYSEDGHDAWNSFTELQHIDLSNSIEVQVSSLDSIIKQYNINESNISLIKIDVEGWEMNVLKGADDFLKNNMHTAFLIEFTDLNAISAGYCTRDIYRYMESFGYQWFSFDAKSMSYNPSPLKLNYPYENLIAVKSIAVLENRI